MRPVVPCSAHVVPDAPAGMVRGSLAALGVTATAVGRELRVPDEAGLAVQEVVGGFVAVSSPGTWRFEGTLLEACRTVMASPARLCLTDAGAIVAKAEVPVTLATPEALGAVLSDLARLTGIPLPLPPSSPVAATLSHTHLATALRGTKASVAEDREQKGCYRVGLPSAGRIVRIEARADGDGVLLQTCLARLPDHEVRRAASAHFALRCNARLRWAKYVVAPDGPQQVAAIIRIPVALATAGTIRTGILVLAQAARRAEEFGALLDERVAHEYVRLCVGPAETKLKREREES